jgi:LPS sulfotransferase NodH
MGDCHSLTLASTGVIGGSWMPRPTGGEQNFICAHGGDTIGEGDPMISYLVCATHRSGSNLLCQALWHTDLCGRPQEFFSPTRAEKIAAEHELTADPGEDYAAYVAELIEGRASPNGVFGGKMMWAHLAPFVAALGNEGEGTEAVLARVFPALRYLWVRRGDKLRQAISMWKAKQTKVYNSLQAGERAGDGPAAEFDFAEIRKCKERFEREDEAWGEFFRSSGIEPVEVVYEEFAANYEAGVASILAEFGIATPDGFAVKSLTYQKLADATNEEWRERYLAMEAGA